MSDSNNIIETTNHYYVNFEICNDQFFPLSFKDNNICISSNNIVAMYFGKYRLNVMKIKKYDREELKKLDETLSALLINRENIKKALGIIYDFDLFCVDFNRNGSFYIAGKVR